MRALILFALLLASPALAEPPKPQPAKPRKVDRADAMELRALAAEFEAMRLQLEAIQRQMQTTIARHKALRDRLKIAPGEEVDADTGEVRKR